MSACFSHVAQFMPHIWISECLSSSHKYQCVGASLLCGWVMSHGWTKKHHRICFRCVPVTERRSRDEMTAMWTCVDMQCVAVCCSVLQCVAVCCSVLQCVMLVSIYACNTWKHLGACHPPSPVTWGYSTPKRTKKSISPSNINLFEQPNILVNNSKLWRGAQELVRDWWITNPSEIYLIAKTIFSTKLVIVPMCLRPHRWCCRYF